jgi:CHAT domain-containing protein/Tfp pilus assembly protein PilF
MAAITEQAREALRLAEGDPGRAMTLAADVVGRALAAHDHASAAIAHRALGLAALHLEDLDTAVRHLRTAVGFGQRAGSPRLTAEARMTLAYALNWRGQPRHALREIDAAVLQLTGVERARAQAQRAAILQQLRQFHEALRSYRKVLPVLRRAGDLLWVQRVLSNRGVVHTYRYEFTAAEADLREAERLSRDLGLDLQIGFVQQNLGFVNAIRGDVPAALHFLDLAEKGFEALEAQLGEVLMDRAELLLSVRQVGEARLAAERAVVAFEEERRRFALPEGRLLVARAAMLQGDPGAALPEARRAVREFTRQGRPEWAELARFAVLSARVSGPNRGRVGVGEVERCADALHAAGWALTALDGRVMAARLALERGDTGRGRRHLEQASRARQRGPAVQRARAWYAEALLRRTAGRRRAAVSAATAGLRILDDHRATLAATDLRAHTSAHRTDLAQLGLRIAIDSGQPEDVLAWAERGRASHLMLRRVRPPDDPVVAQALAELRLTSAQLTDARRAGQATAGLVQRQVAIETSIRDHVRRQRGDATRDPAEPVPVEQLAAALGEAAMVEFIELDGTLHATTLVDGQLGLRLLAPVADLRDLIDRMDFSLRRLARSKAHPAGQSAAAAMLRHDADHLDAVLLRPFADQLGERALLLVPTGPLQSVPWSTLPSCVGRPVTIAPSAALWLTASGLDAGAAGPALVAAGPRLEGAAAEAETIAAIYGGANALVGAAATVEAVAAALDGAPMAHLAAHGKIRADSPLFSSLVLYDGELTLYDLERLARAPATVVLAACESARPITRPGDELLGFSATFLTRDTRQLIAPVVQIPDAQTVPLMVGLHRRLAAGQPAAAALADAQWQAARDESTATMATAAGFVCVGAGLS